jgi:hypothetical protein
VEKKKARLKRANLVDCLDLAVDLRQRRHQGRAPRRIRGILRENITSLQIQRLFLAFAYCVRLLDLTPSFFADETVAGAPGERFVLAGVTTGTDFRVL